MTRDGMVEFGFGGIQEVSGLLLSSIRHPVAPEQSVTTATPAPSVVLDSKAQSSSSATVLDIQMPEQRSGIELKRINEVDWQRDGNEVKVGLDALILETVRYSLGTEITLSNGARSDVKQLFDGLTYLRASRKRPARGYQRRADGRPLVGYAGEWTASILNTAAEKGLSGSYSEPPTIPSTVNEAQAAIDAAWEPRTERLSLATATWLQRLGLATAVDTRESARDPGLVETRVTLGEQVGQRDITEVGFGVSQVLPVLVGGLLQGENGLFVVDLPEAHLHPRPQGVLADFFCSLALAGRSCLVETHSEMFFLRLRLLCAMNSKLMDNVAVYFIEPPTADGLCSMPRRVGLSFEDELRWPKGFLQDAWETETQTSAVREARGKAK
jgi:hypothetical protein